MVEHKPIPAETERLAKETIDAAFKVHKYLGPGLLESVYEACLAHELRQRGITVDTQVALPVVYKDIHLDAGLCLDMLVADCVVVELKVAEQMKTLFEAQLLTYLKLSGRRLGLLVNFNVPLIKDGIKRVVL